MQDTKQGQTKLAEIYGYEITAINIDVGNINPEKTSEQEAFEEEKRKFWDDFDARR